MSDVDQSIARVLEAYAAAVHEKDPDKLVSLYDRSARIFDAWGVWVYEGAEAWQRAIEGWFASLGTGRVKVGFEDVRTMGTPEFAAVSGIVGYAGVSATGEPLQSMQNRFSWVLRTSGHVLRIVHEHTSAPVGFDDMKAILRRTPSA